jgi:hypothetical protein
MRRREFIAIASGAGAWPFGALAAQLQVPVVGVLDGASSSGSVPFVAAFPTSAGYVQVSELPIRRLNKFEINLKTTKALGLIVPPLLLADEVIE